MTQKRGIIMDFNKFSVDKDTPIPLYYQVKKIILDRILSGDIKPGETIPTEKAFCEIYDISRTTVRQAITELVNEGYLYRVKSKGTFVSQPKIKTDLTDLFDGFNTELFSRDMLPSVKLIKAELRKADKEEAQFLQIPEGEEIVYIVRHQYADNEPMTYIKSYIKYPLCDFVLADPDLQTRSVLDVLSKNKHSKVNRMVRTIESASANDFQSKLFNIKKGSPVQICKHTGYSAETASPIIFETLIGRGDKMKFTMEFHID